MEISPQYTWSDSDKDKQTNHFLLPDSIRALLVGHPNCGKSTLMYNLLLRPGFMNYDNLLVFGNSLQQIEYRIIHAAFEKKLSKEQIDVIFKNQDKVNKNGGPLSVIQDYDGECRGKITVSFYTSCKDIPDPSSLDPKLRNLILFDDCMEGEQSKISTYYTRGRHNNISSFYITQSYFKIPRQGIRLNVNFLILFRQSNRDMQNIYHDHVSHDGIPFEIFIRDFCVKSWDLGPHNFICIDLTKTKDTGKFRRGLDSYWFPPLCMEKNDAS